MKKVLDIRWIVLAIPFALGVYGYQLIYGDNLLGSVYSALRLYGLNIDVPEKDINVYIQAARWLAALATTTVLLVLFRRILTEIRLRWILRNPECVVIHGDGVRKEIVAATLGKNAVPMSAKVCMNARKHVLAFETDAAAIAYLHEHEDVLLGRAADKSIYFSSSEFEPSDYAQSGLVISNNAVNCARLYWSMHWIKDAHTCRIAIVGFGHYGQRLLEQALLVNVTVRESPIEYHIYGTDGSDFCMWHAPIENCIAINQTDSKRDSIHFYSEMKSGGLSKLCSMDRIIIAHDDANQSIIFLNQLLASGIGGSIHVYCNSGVLKQVQYMPERQKKQENIDIEAFGDESELYSAEILLHGKLIEMAKTEHIVYVRSSLAANIRSKYIVCKNCGKAGKCQACLRADDTWDDLTPFEKASNIALADHNVVKRSMLQGKSSQELESIRELLCKVEHERWRRFYYLHNWTYGDIRDNARRKHPSLQPYEHLSADEQKKDWWSYQSILEERTE